MIRVLCTGTDECVTLVLWNPHNITLLLVVNSLIRLPAHVYFRSAYCIPQAEAKLTFFVSFFLVGDINQGPVQREMQWKAPIKPPPMDETTTILFMAPKKYWRGFSS